MVFLVVASSAAQAYNPSRVASHFRSGQRCPHLGRFIMPKFKIKVDKAGNFYTQAVLKLDAADVGPEPSKKKITLKLLKPPGASIEVMTVTIIAKKAQKTFNVAVSTGTPVTAGPYPVNAGDNKISFEGTSDKPGVEHEVEVNLVK
jgi:hypothetical protein